MAHSESFTVYQRNNWSYFYQAIQAGCLGAKIYVKLLLFSIQKRTERYVVCRPQGGLNDMLVQIANCFHYSYKYKRCLVIDTRKSGFLDDFNNYFQPLILFKNLLLSEPESLKHNSKFMSCLPKSLFGRGLDYESKFNPETNYVDVDTGERLMFSFDQDHQEDLLVYEQCGGGDNSIFAFHFLRFNEKVKKEINRRLSILPSLYIAIHIRNTDVKTDFVELFKAVKKYVDKENLLICTDSMEVLLYAKSYLRDTRIFSLANLPDSKGKSLHHNPEITDWNINVGALTDLIAMSLSQKLILPTKHIGYPSGFANLGRLLFERQYLVKQLLN
jgi:hypothetical protein